MSLRRSVPSSLVLLLCGRLALVPPRRVLLLPLWFRLLPFLRLRRFSSSSSAAVRASLFEIGCLPVYRLLSTSSSMGHSPLVVTLGHFRRWRMRCCLRLHLRRVLRRLLAALRCSLLPPSEPFGLCATGLLLAALKPKWLRKNIRKPKSRC